MGEADRLAENLIGIVDCVQAALSERISPSGFPRVPAM